MRYLHGSRAAIALGIFAAVAAACGGGEQQADAGAGDSVAAPAAGGATASAGEQLYQRCVTCHMANGEGTPGVFPPLAGSEYATAANVAVPIRIVLHGIQGPINVKGTEYNGLMPAYGTGIAMTDEEVAAVLTYVRQSFGNSASPVTAADVAKERAATQSQSGAVTAADLQPLMQ